MADCSDSPLNISADTCVGLLEIDCADGCVNIRDEPSRAEQNRLLRDRKKFNTRPRSCRTLSDCETRRYFAIVTGSHATTLKERGREIKAERGTQPAGTTLIF